MMLTIDKCDSRGLDDCFVVCDDAPIALAIFRSKEDAELFVHEKNMDVMVFDETELIWQETKFVPPPIEQFREAARKTVFNQPVFFDEKRSDLIPPFAEISPGHTLDFGISGVSITNNSDKTVYVDVLKFHSKRGDDQPLDPSRCRTYLPASSAQPLKFESSGNVGINDVQPDVILEK